MKAGAALDRIDLRILAALQADARITNQALADAVGLSPSACLTRVRRLEATGLILGYHARLAVERIRPAVTVFGEVTLKSHRPADLAVFEAELQEIPEVVEASQVSGPFESNPSRTSTKPIVLIPDRVEAVDQPSEPYLF